MATYPQSAVGLNYITYPAGPTAAGSTVTGGAGANTKGSYTQFVASTTFASNRLHIDVPQTNTTSQGYLLDIATGAAASEVVVLPNVLAGSLLNTAPLMGAETIDFNLAIASSTRVSARCQCSLGSGALTMALTLVAAGYVPGLASFTTDGVSGSTGTTIDPGGTANTKGAYAQLSASTATITQFYAISLSVGGNTTRTNSATWAIDLATGAAGSEVVLVPDERASAGGGANPMLVMVPQGYSDMTYIAASTRIAMRASCGTNNATDRVFKAVFIYGRAPSEPSGTGTEFPSIGLVS